MVSVLLSGEKFSQTAFDKFCQKNLLNFPQQFIKFLSQYNDGELEVNFVDGFDECCIRYFFGTTSEAYSNIEDVFECYKGRMPNNCIPIAEAEGGNLVCISLFNKTYGKIYFWDHETMDVEDGEKCEYSIESMPLIAGNFDDLLDKICAF